MANEIEKALQAIAEAIDDKDAVETVKVTITIKKPKPSKT
jgi:hypothetical protein